MRRWLASVLLPALVLAGCTGKPPSVPPQPPEPAQVVTTPPASAVWQADLITAAPAGSLRRIQIKPGQPIGRTGRFFMNVATSAVEGWVIGDDPNGPSPDSISRDHRWVSARLQETQYLADRQTGAVSRWNAAVLRLVAARGDVLLFMVGTQFWLTRDGLKRFVPLDLPPIAQPQAEIAPDGHSLVLVGDRKVYHIQTESGQVTRSGQIEPPAGANPNGNIMMSAGSQDVGVIITGSFSLANQPYRGVTLVQRYSWAGRLLDNRTAPGTAHFSPNGKAVAWDDYLLGLDHALIVGTTDFQPRVRMTGESTCSLPFQGPYWLPDSSGLVVSTTQGPRLLKVDGTLEKLALVAALNPREMPVPAPNRSDLYVVGGITVMDGSGKKLAEAVPFSPGGQWLGVRGDDPWGDRSDEVRFTLFSGGKGVSCDPSFLPPQVDRAPFPSITGLMVKVTGTDCVNLRQATDLKAPVVTCLPNGTRLLAAVPPGVNNKGALTQLNPLGWWWYVRTDQGQRGWVSLSAEYLTWAVAKPGEPTPDLMLLRVNDEIANLRFWLRVAVGEEACGGNCFPGPSLTDSIWGVMTWCKQGPAALRADPAFDPARHGPGVAALESACTALLSARDTLGQVDGGAWQQKVQDVLAALP